MQIIGLMSGTSVDGIDAALIEITGKGFELTVHLHHGQTTPYPPELRSRILAVCAGQPLSMAEFADLDDAIAQVFAAAAQALQAAVPRSEVQVIASHGQTVYHRPPPASRTEAATALGYSLQLGRGAVIAERTGIMTISNFRAADIARGGQGAPLVPPVDVALFSHPTRSRCIQNIGGIGNVTVLPAWDRQSPTPPPVRGWDTGPGNALIDMAVQRLSGGQQTYDRHGAWASQGTPAVDLIDTWLQQPYFQAPPPKSTGREYFSPAYLDSCWQEMDALQLSDCDRLATLTDFTAATIAHSYQQFLAQMPAELLVCGGGSQNHYLRHCLSQRLPGVTVQSTSDYGIPADFKEAIAFAVLGFWRYQGTPGNLPTVTGARQLALLGDIHVPAQVQPLSLMESGQG